MVRYIPKFPTFLNFVCKGIFSEKAVIFFKISVQNREIFVKKKVTTKL